MTDLLDFYTYRVLWSDADGMFIGLCAELPSLSHLDDTAEGAFTGIRDVTATALEIHARGQRPAARPVVHPQVQRRFHGQGPAGDPPGFGVGRRRGRRQPQPAGSRKIVPATLAPR